MPKSEVAGQSRFLELCDELLDEVVGGNPEVCLALVTVAPVVNQVDPSILFINTTDRPGDTFVLGEFFWDCPPYEPPT